MITISNISFFRFCLKNRKLDWPKCARTVFNSLETFFSLSGTSPDTILVHFKTKQSINGETEIFSNELTHDFGQKM